jgi:hypothetical protein
MNIGAVQHLLKNLPAHHQEKIMIYINGLRDDLRQGCDLLISNASDDYKSEFWTEQGGVCHCDHLIYTVTLPN